MYFVTVTESFLFYNIIFKFYSCMYVYIIKSDRIVIKERVICKNDEWSRKGGRKDTHL